MKRLILVIASAALMQNLAGITAKADPTWLQQMMDPQWRYQQVQEWQTIQHPILTKVFPGVQFKIGEGVFTLPTGTINHVAGLYEGKAWHMIAEFNTLFARVPNTAKVKIEEKIEAFIRLDLWLQDSALIVASIEKGDYVFGEYFKYEYKVVVEMNHWYRANGPTQLEIYFKITNGQIDDVQLIRDGKGEGGATPLLHSYRDDEDASLVVSGQGVNSEQLGDTIYYFLSVTINDSLTGNYFHLKVTGLDTAQYVRIIVVNEYWVPPRRTDYAVLSLSKSLIDADLTDFADLTKPQPINPYFRMIFIKRFI
jgi:hypothetical protein